MCRQYEQTIQRMRTEMFELRSECEHLRRLVRSLEQKLLQLEARVREVRCG
jgi:phage shock protein A